MSPDATPFLVGGLAVACLTDLQDRRIPNTLVVALAAVGLGGAASGWLPGLTLPGACAGLALGLALWLPFHVLGMLGAGDVKLFAAAAAWLGPRHVVDAALLTALAGGVLAALALLAREGPRAAAARVVAALHAPHLLRLAPAPDAIPMPYALPIAVGVLGARWLALAS